MGEAAGVRRFAYTAHGHDHYWCEGCTDECEFGPCCEYKTVRVVPYEGDIEVLGPPLVNGQPITPDEADDLFLTDHRKRMDESLGGDRG